MTNVTKLAPVATPAECPSYTYEMVFVTPEMARAWLDGMREQRRIRKNNLSKLVRIIETGRWRIMPHGLVFSVGDSLIDGQHRCRAIVDTGKGQWLMVIRGCPAEYYGLIGDVSAPKNGEDVLRAAGCSGGALNYVGAATRMLWRGLNGHGLFNMLVEPTNEELVKTYAAFRAAMDEAGAASSQLRDLCSSPGTLTYVLTCGLTVDAEKTRRFVEDVRSGLNLGEGDPALLLRNTWIEHRVRKDKVSPVKIGIEAATALNLHLHGQKRKSWRKVDFDAGMIPTIG